MSNSLKLLDLHSNDVDEGNRARAGSLYAVFDPPLKGGEIAFFAIVPERGARLFRPFGHLF